MTLNGHSVAFDLVSTWDEQCGIFEYANALLCDTTLTAGLAQVFARRAAEQDKQEVHASHIDCPVHRCWTSESNAPIDLIEGMNNSSSQALWFQYHPSFFDERTLHELTRALPEMSYRQRVLTVHNPDKLGKTSFLSAFTAIVVHNQDAFERINALCDGKALIIPHFIYSRNHFKRQKPSDRFTVATAGFAARNKRVPMLVEGFEIAHALYPNMQLHILTSPFPTHAAHFEQSRIVSAIKRSPAHSAIVADMRPKSMAYLLEAVSRAHILCMPYKDTAESASGAARLGLSAGTPVLRSKSTIFADFPGGDLVMNQCDAQSIAEALIMLAQTPNLLERKRAEVDNIYDLMSAEKIAERYHELLQ